MPKSILNISRDEALLNTRTEILRIEGFKVLPASNDEEIVSLLKSATSPFDLVLLCHSLPEESRVSLVRQLKAQYPQLPIVLVDRSDEATEAAVDAVVPGLDSPTKVITMIKVLLDDNR